MREQTALCIVALVLLGACGGLDQPARPAPAAGSLLPSDAAAGAPDFALSLPSGEEGARVPPRTVGTLFATEVDVLDYTASSGLSKHNFEGMDYALLTPPEPGECAWALYAAQPEEDERLYCFNIDVADDYLDDEMYEPDLPWWVGIANYASGRWEWHGPYTDFMAQPMADNDLPREAYVNDAGLSYWVILSYCPRDAAPAGMSLLMMDVVTTDSAPGQPPY